jgi:hypothetical protein
LLQGAVVVELSTDAIRALPDVSAGSSDEK